MPVHNAEIAGQFDRLADLLEIEGANPFRIRAYRNAARLLAGLPHSVVDMLEQGEDLQELPGIGKDLAAKIRTIAETGALPQLRTIERRTPAALSELMRIEGLGPKRVKALYEQLRIRSTADLRRAVDKQRVRQLRGFGPKTEARILEALQHLAAEDRRTSIAEAEQIAAPLLAWLRGPAGVKRATIAGSFRRRCDTVGDLDLLVTAKTGTAVMDRLVAYDEVREVLARGKTRSTVRLRCGMQVDLRLVPEVSYGAALHYFTGSKAHNIAVRKLAQKKKLKLNEYGLFRGPQRIAGRTEQEIYARIGLEYIEPELRENQGEVDAARRDALPRLVKLGQIRGDLHCHTSATDGHATLQQMVEAAQQRGYGYLAITDHSRSVTIAHGLDEKGLRRQLEAIDRINEQLRNIVVLKSIEVDVLEDGSLDLPDRILAELDLVVCAVHSRLHLSRRKQTERMLRAMDNIHCNILAHPTGRLINERTASDLDLRRIMEHARDVGCVLEINAQPSRLDLDGNACRMAKEIGVKLVISTDAHRPQDFELMRFGVDQARRGWLEKSDIVNTRPLAEMGRLLRR